MLLQALALAGVLSLLQMVLPVFTQIIVDRVIVEQDVDLLRVLIGGMGFTMVFVVLALNVAKPVRSAEGAARVISFNVKPAARLFQWVPPRGKSGIE